MPATELAVFDSSVGVKWFKPEAGHDEALALLADHRDGRAQIIVASHFLHELVAVAVRHGGVAFGEHAWEALSQIDLTVIGLDAALASGAFAQCRALNCSFYDALAPAIAARLGAVLISSDKRAHHAFPNVRFI